MFRSAWLDVPVRWIAEMCGEKVDQCQGLGRHERPARIDRPDRHGFGERITVEDGYELAAAQIRRNVPGRFERNPEARQQRVADHFAVIGGETSADTHVDAPG